MEAKSFGDLITFSRASVARYFNSSGLLVQAAADVPRFEFDPTTLAPRGLKMEPPRTNSLTFSQDFTNAAWGKVNCSIAGAAGVAPDGSNTAGLMSVTAVGGGVYLWRAAQAWANATPYSFGFFAKAAGTTGVTISLPAIAFGVGQQVNFSLTGTGAFVVVAGTVRARIQQCSNGWYHCSVTMTTTAAGTQDWAAIQLGQAIGNSVQIWGVQLEVGEDATSYIPTTTAAASRAQDLAYVDNVSPWLKQKEGTLLAEMVYLSSSLGFAANLQPDGVAGAAVRISLYTNVQLITQVYDDSAVAIFGYGWPGETARGQVYKHAVAYKENDIRAVLNGTLSNIQGPGSPPTVDRLTIGARGVSTNPINGYIRNLKYYPSRLSIPELQAITT
ncbi:hypothetical protein DM813_19235 [Pseudomonas alkylphenolica]|uniref:Uncharacterized protein n=1 Tax=Pseudomonas alkylphenolica TaxID=237609 RepID=A0A443ZQF5_9PSED|nr:hypothetical protein [Pseudomonas alkylphenolica]RWU21321.1 hypothetical protein DM813_19235 [Pseudomonas alkylphenolica]